jgi:ATP-dependent DNA ligase
MDIISQYKKRVLSRLISVEPSKLKEKILDSEYYLVSEKLDGFYTVLVSDSKGIKLFNKSGRELKIPSIQSIKLDKPCVLVGELCSFLNDRPQTHRELAAAIAKPDKSDIRFAAFDVLEINGSILTASGIEKFNLLKELANQKNCFTIPQNQFASRTEVEEFYKQIVDKSGEGIIVKAANELAYKIKPIITLDLVVLGFCEGIQEKAGVVRDLLLGVAIEDNHFQVVGTVGTGFNTEDRNVFYKALSPLSVNSTYTEVSGAKTAFVMVKPEWVVEVSCLDILGENSKGTIKRPLLKFDKSGYDLIEQNAGVSLVSAVFMRRRTDKIPSISHAGKEQLLDFLNPQSEPEQALKLTDSEIVSREVYTKKGKNGLMVRKMVGLKTNKEQTGLFPKYVVLFTDFSSGRAEPMNQDITLCEDNTSMENTLQFLRDEYVKGGWAKVN